MKRILCAILSLTLIFFFFLTVSAEPVQDTEPADPAAMITCDEAIAAYEALTGEKLETRRYYFQMPDGVHGMLNEDGEVIPTWYNEFSSGAGVFWWGNFPAACKSWPGYRAMTADADQHIYYVNMPAEVDALIWNNGVAGGTDAAQPVYEKARQTVDISCEPAEPGEYDTMPEGCDNFDECIYILQNEPDTTAVYSVRMPVPGAWYFYYGSGCYGMYNKASANFKSTDENCCNPDHFDPDGKHIGYIPENPLRGDYDRDGEITILDATRAQNIIAELITRPSEAFLEKVDADGDKVLTILDATRIQNVLALLMTMDGIQR